MSNLLGMRRAKRKCAPSLFTQRPHHSTDFGAGVGLPCTVLASYYTIKSTLAQEPCTQTLRLLGALS
jgi:hypothetical protein